MTDLAADLPQFFLDRITVDDAMGCWLWSSKRVDGYGRVRLVGRQYKRAHRVVWELLRGPIPAGLTIDHLCRVKNCVNPQHKERERV